MRIGLMRHFKVIHQSDRKWMNSEQFKEWIEQYDHSAIQLSTSSTLEDNWDVCLSSDLSRAVGTAETVYQGDIVQTSKLREIGIAPPWHTRLKLHYNLWLMLGRAAWYMSHKSQQETRTQTRTRARQVIDSLESYKDSNILIVCHGAFMRCLHQELLRSGYKGKGFAHPRNGILYAYEREEA